MNTGGHGPLVSVVIPAHNAVGTIGRALRSVAAQDYPAVEVIVVDDGSWDETLFAAVEASPDVRWIRQPNAGVSAARNTGIREARGEYIAFLDADDEWTDPGKTALQAEILQRDPEVGLVFSRMEDVDTDGRTRGVKPAGPIGRDFRGLLEEGGHLPTSTVMVRRRCFETAGLFDERLRVYEDFDMWIRIAKDWGIIELEGKLLGRYHRPCGLVKRNRVLLHESKLYLLEKILRSYNECPELIRVQRNRETYLLAKALYDGGDVRAAPWVRLALSRDPAIGKRFWEEGDGVWRRLVKLLKPYGLLAAAHLNMDLKDPRDGRPHQEKEGAWPRQS